MRIAVTLLLPALLAACGGDANSTSADGWDKQKGKGDEFKVPVQVQIPGRATVEDWVATQANLESDRRALILAEVDGRIVRKHRDLGDRIGSEEGGENANPEAPQPDSSEGTDLIHGSGQGSEPFLLASIDDRDMRLALREATIKVLEVKGRLGEAKVDHSRAERTLEQTQLEEEGTASVLRRTTEGIADGTITAEEHEKAQFAEKVANAKVRAVEADLEKTRLEVELGAVLVLDAEVKEERARVALEKSQLRAPFEGVVSFCRIQVGERVRVGDHLYTVEDPARIVLYAEIPVREANRIQPGNTVHVASSALPVTTVGRVELVAPTVDSAAGTIRVKISVAPQAGFRPGLFVSVRIVVETRENALVVPKRAVLHDDETGSYLFVVRDNKAHRVRIGTGFERDDVIEVVEGVAPGDAIVIEGQDTVTDGSDVEIQTTEP